MLNELLQTNLYAYTLIFLRIGTIFMLMPGFGASYVNPQIRLIISLAVTIILCPFLSSVLPAQPNDFSTMLLYMLNEISTGIFLGMLMQILFFALNFAGSIASQAIGFANAQLFDPAFQNQSMLIESFLSVIALTFIFETNIHHMMISALVDSYQLFTVGSPLPWSDMVHYFAQTLNHAFTFGFKLGAPFIAFTIIFYSCLGLVSRLMPQLNIFFLSLPLQIYLGLGLLFLTVPVIISVFFNYYGEGLHFFIE